MKNNDSIQTKEIQAQISNGKTSVPVSLSESSPGKLKAAKGWWGGCQSNYHTFFPVAKLSAWLILISCADASIYETAVNLVM